MIYASGFVCALMVTVYIYLRDVWKAEVNGTREPDGDDRLGVFMVPLLWPVVLVFLPPYGAVLLAERLMAWAPRYLSPAAMVREAARLRIAEGIPDSA